MALQTIPEYEAPRIQPGVTPQPATPEASVPSAGGAGARAVGEIGQAITSAAQAFGGKLLEQQRKEKELHDQSQALDRYYALDATMRSKLLGHTDALGTRHPGLLELQYGRAVGVTDQGLQAFDDTFNQLSESLVDDGQRALFQKLALEHRVGLARQLATHEGGELQKADEHAFTSGLSLLVSAGALHVDQLDANLKQIDGLVQQRAALLGMPDATKQQLLQHWRTEAVGSAVANMVRDNPRGSQVLLDRYKATLDGTRVDNLQKLVDGTLLSYDGELAARKLVAQAVKPSGEIDNGKLQRLLDTQPVGKARDATVAHAWARASRINADWRDRAQTLGTAVLPAMTGDDGRIDTELAKANAPEAWAAFQKTDPDKAATWDRISAQNRSARGKQQLREDEARAYVEASTWMAENWDAVAKLNEYEFTSEVKPRVPPQKWTALLDRYRALQKSIEVVPDEKKVLDEAKQALGFGTKADIGKLPPEKKQLFSDLIDEVGLRLREERIAAGPTGRLDPEKVREITRELLAPVVIKEGVVSDTTAPLFQVRAQQRQDRPRAEIQRTGPDGKIQRALVPLEQLQQALDEGWRLP